MLKNIVRDLVILFCIAALWASTSRTAMQYVADHRNVDKWWGSYQCLNGDLVSLSYLDFVKTFNPPRVPFILKRPVYDGPKRTALYLYGDSHTWHLNDTDFAGISAFHYIERIHHGYFHLDTSKRNVLIIEISERYALNYFGSLQMKDEFYDSATEKKNIAGFYKPEHANTKYASLAGMLPINFFNRFINQNLQCNLFNYQFMMPMFESKAALNYYFFNRASGDVVISDDRNFLFLKQTVSHDDLGSSYAPVPADKINNAVNNLNSIYDHYKAKGFNEVYFSIIPNSATIMQPGGYNNLIPLIQNDPHLKMKSIDVYDVFKNSSQLFFRPGDTHWNLKGLQKWLDIVNDTLTRK